MSPSLSMMPRLPLLVLALAFTSLRSDAAMFPKKSNVQQIDSKGFRAALKENRTFVTAFVAPWCGHCQKLVPELVRAADGLHPLVPVYAVDCDDNQNKPLCAEQGVQGFPTIKLFPRGKKVPPLDFDGTRSASSIFYWASRGVPSTISRTQTTKGISEFVAKNAGKPKAMLLNKSNKTPLLWKVLSNKYSSQVAFGNCRDRKGKVSVELGYEAGDKSKPKVLVYGPDDTAPVLYEGVLKFAALSKFFDEVIEGTVDISRASLDAKQEVLNAPESVRKNLDDETRIGDAGYAGFKPHEGMDMNELLKRGMNPHAHGHPGAANPHPSDDSISEKATITTSNPREEQSSTIETVSETESLVNARTQSSSPDEKPTQPVESSGKHSKDEL